MDLVKEKELIKQQIDLMEDEKVLTAVKNMLSLSRLHHENLKPISIEELKERAIASEAAIKNGNVISLESLKKEILMW
ncbi:MAG: hypothetical protein WDA22_09960 [Bacteroidota bacterium]